MNTITVNGSTISASGNVVIKNNRVIVNGVDITPDSKEINITITGETNKIEVDNCNKIEVQGNVGSVKTISGDIEISGDVTGSVSSMSGDIDCGNIGGSVSTMSGDIKTRKNN